MKTSCLLVLVVLLASANAVDHKAVLLGAMYDSPDHALATVECPAALTSTCLMYTFLLERTYKPDAISVVFSDQCDVPQLWSTIPSCKAIAATTPAGPFANIHIASDRAAFFQYLQGVGNKDTNVFVYVVGHGKMTPPAEKQVQNWDPEMQGAIILSKTLKGTEGEDVAPVSAHWIKSKDWADAQLLPSTSFKKLLVYAETCFGGGLVRPEPTSQAHLQAGKATSATMEALSKAHIALMFASFPGLPAAASDAYVKAFIQVVKAGANAASGTIAELNGNYRTALQKNLAWMMEAYGNKGAHSASKDRPAMFQHDRVLDVNVKPQLGFGQEQQAIDSPVKRFKQPSIQKAFAGQPLLLPSVAGDIGMPVSAFFPRPTSSILPRVVKSKSQDKTGKKEQQKTDKKDKQVPEQNLPKKDKDTPKLPTVKEDRDVEDQDTDSDDDNDSDDDDDDASDE